MRVLPTLALAISTAVAIQGDPSSIPVNVTSFSTALSGSFVPLRPPAAPCHAESFNATQCQIVRQNWTVEGWRSAQMGSMQTLVWEQLGGQWCLVGDLDSTEPVTAPCAQGNIPKFGVPVITPDDVLSAVNVARAFNLSLVVKNTGHDYLGRSANASSLLIWTHHMKNSSVADFTTCGKTYTKALRVGAGVQWGQGYAAAANASRVVPGGADPNVGSSGGQVMGGGHGPLTNTYGLTSDNIIHFEVVTADGTIRNVSACENSDLFWALRGGGGGTYAIVTTTTFQTYPESPIAHGFLRANITNASYKEAVKQLGYVSPQMVDDGWTGYFWTSPGIVRFTFLQPLIQNRTQAAANKTLTDFFDKLSKVPNLNVIEKNITFYPSFRAGQPAYLYSGPGADTTIMGSRLIPKAMVADNSSLETIATVFSSLHNDTANQLVLGHIVAGSPIVSTTTNSSILPAWRTAIWHVEATNDVPLGANQSVIDSVHAFVTDHQTAMMKNITPGSGAFMNEADSRAPDWKNDFYGANYDRLLTIKRKYDPQLLLRCNRCVGYDL